MLAWSFTKILHETVPKSHVKSFDHIVSRAILERFYEEQLIKGLKSSSSNLDVRDKTFKQY